MAAPAGSLKLNISPSQITGSAYYASNTMPVNAFDGTPNYWYVFSTNPPAGGHWVQVDLGAGNEKNISYVELSALQVSGANHSIKDWTLSGSNNGSTWTQIAVGSNHVNGPATVGYPVSSSNAYRYIRWAFQSSYYDAAGRTGGAAEITLYAVGDPPPVISPIIGSSYTSKTGIKLTGSITHVGNLMTSYRVTLNGTELVSTGLLATPISLNVTMLESLVIFGTNILAISATASNGMTSSLATNFTVVKDTVTVTNVQVAEAITYKKPLKLTARITSARNLKISYDVNLNGVLVASFTNQSSPVSVDYMLPQDKMIDNTNLVAVVATTETSDPATGTTTFYTFATPTAMAPMSFTIEFPSGTKDPMRNIGTESSYNLHYLNSEFGGSGIFRYMPYNVFNNILIPAKPRIADLKPKTGRPTDYVNAVRIDRSGIHHNEQHVATARNRLEAIISNGFYGIVERATGLIRTILSFDKALKDTGITHQYHISRQAFLDTTYKHELSFGFRPDEEALIKAYAIGHDTEPVLDGILRAFNFAARELPAPIYEVGKYIISEMKDFNDAHMTSMKVGMNPDKDGLTLRAPLAKMLKEKIGVSREQSIGERGDYEGATQGHEIADHVYLNLGIMPAVFAAQSSEPELPAMMLMTTVEGTKIDHLGHISRLVLTERPLYAVVTGEMPTMVSLIHEREGYAAQEATEGVKRDQQTVVYHGYTMIDSEARRAARNWTQHGDRQNQYSSVIHELQTFSPPEYEQAVVGSLTVADLGVTNHAMFYETMMTEIFESLHAVQGQLILADAGRSKTAVVYDELMTVEGSVQKNALLGSAGSKIVEGGIVKGAIIEWLRSQAEGSVQKNSVIVRLPVMAEGNKSMQGLLERTLKLSDRLESGSLLLSRQTLVDGDKSADGTMYRPPVIAHYKSKATASVERRVMLVDMLNRDAVIDARMTLVNRKPSDALIEFRPTLVIGTDFDAFIDNPVVLVEQIRRDMIIDTRFTLVQNVGKDSMPIMGDERLATPVGRNSDYDFIDKLAIILPEESMIVEIDKRASRMQRESFIQYALITMDKSDKVGLIVKYWSLFNRLSLEAREYEDAAHKLADRAVRSSDSRIDGFKDYQKTDKELKDMALYRYLMFEKADIDSMIVQLVGMDDKLRYDMVIDSLLLSDREQEEQSGIKVENPLYDLKDPSLDGAVVRLETGERSDFESPGIKIDQKTAERREIYGIVQKLIAAHDESKLTRPAFGAPNPKLVGDTSDWDDIWDRYTPGVDIIDVPTSDFDYEKLILQVYDPETGVPKNPRGPTNKPDVKVKTPLHHPLPANFDIGVDEAVVDNFILIDVILATESLKNRNSLRYAGMPAERAVREVMSKLFAWIQQVAPGSVEYDRTFRLVRWYSESAVLSLSEHILHRTYLPWKSRLHLNDDLGVPYTATGWRYFGNQSIIQTTATEASLKFDQTTYIDSTMIVRGFIDNPNGEVRFQIKDGDTVLAEFDADDNGAFSVTFDLLAGHRTFELAFQGASGRISISSMEIGGVVFTGAFTTSDDTNTNGLKALTKVMTMLLTYYDIHHGDGKIKGSMSVKQRKVWNQT